MPDTRPALVAAATLATLLAAAGAGAAQPIERSLVVSVVDRGGAPAAGLQAADFLVREDGARREVLRAARDTRPKQIALLIDTSAAAAGAVTDFRNGVVAFVETLPGGDEIALIGFGERPRILAPATRDAGRLREGAGRIFAWSGTAAYLLDALSETTRGFARRAAPRPVIVVLATEGLDHSHADVASVQRELEAARVNVHAVVLKDGGRRASSGFGFGAARSGPAGPGPPGFERAGFDAVTFGGAQDGLPPPWRLDRDRMLDQAPRAGGGRRRDALASTGAEAALREVARELSNQYLVTYARPAALVPPRNVDVRVVRDGAELDVRALPAAGVRQR